MMTLYTAPGEMQLRVIESEAGTCSHDDAPLALGVFCWPTETPWGPDRSTYWSHRHADGSECHNPDGPGCWPKPKNASTAR